MTLYQHHDGYTAEIDQAASELVERYGAIAPRVAREWAEIKFQQGAPQTAVKWLHVADKTRRAEAD